MSASERRAPGEVETAHADEVVATLVLPTQYVRHLNQVVALTTSDVVFLKRKFVSRSGHELVRYPLSACATVQHHDERPVATIVSGLLLSGLVLAVVVLLALEWNELDAGTRVPVGALALAGVYGVRRVVGARRHRLVFTLRDGTRLTWISRPGEHDAKRRAVENVLELARARELLRDGRLVRR